MDLPKKNLTVTKKAVMSFWQGTIVKTRFCKGPPSGEGSENFRIALMCLKSVEMM